MDNSKSIRQLNKENADKLWEALQAYRGDPLKKHELIALCDFNNAAGQGYEEIFKIAIRHCRRRAEKAGLFIPMAAPDSKYTYVLTSDPTLAVGGWHHATRIAEGTKKNARRHSDFINREKEKLPRSQRRIFEELENQQNRVLELEEEYSERNKKLLLDLANDVREELLENEKGAGDGDSD